MGSWKSAKPSSQTCPRCGIALPPRVAEGLCPRCLFASLGKDDAPENAAEANAPPVAAEYSDWRPRREFGDYELLEEIGRGGMGLVYRARQVSLNRPVAIKVIKLGMDTRAVIARFEAERQALALMDHPNIARVFDAGATDAGRPYFVMELVRGLKITEYCDRQGLSVRERLSLFIKVCQAVQHAHQKGIIHRDLKPSNILVAELDGEAVPKVIDFGIAKATETRPTDQALFTAAGQIIGTPAYLSPEQAELGGLDVDTRTDVYSLGVLLYELLTGHLPFDPQELAKSSLDEVRRVIREQQPPRPSTRLAKAGDRKADASGRAGEAGGERPEDGSQSSDGAAQSEPIVPLRRRLQEVRGDLDWIVMKCLEKDRARRYATANGLAADLQRHLDNEPVLARPPSRLYEFQKSLRRHKAGFAATAAIIAVLAAGVWVSTVEAVRARRAELVARQRAYAADMNFAHRALAEDNPRAVLELLDAQRPRPGEKDLRGWEWRYLWQQTRSDALFTLCRQSSQINSLAISGDGHWLAVGLFHKGGPTVWDLRTREQVVVALAKNEELVRVAFSPVEPLLAFTGVNFPASGGQQATLHLWSGARREMVAEVSLDHECKGLAFSRDGRTLVTSTAGGFITLWRVPEATPLVSWPCEQSSLDLGTVFAATLDLRLAAYGLQGGKIRVIDLRDGKELWTAHASKDRITALAFSPDGAMLASAAGIDASVIRLWNVTTGRELGPLVGHRTEVFSLVFWPDGRKLASGGADTSIRIWEVPSGRCLDELHGHPRPVWRVALLPGGQKLVSGSKDGTVCVWDASVRHARQPLIALPTEVLAWVFAPDSRSILTLERQRQAARWTGPEFQQREPLLEIGTNPPAAPGWNSFSPLGTYLASASTNGVIQIWDISRRVLSCQLTTKPAGYWRLQFLADENRLITWCWESGAIQEWDVRTGSEIQAWLVPPTFGDGGLAVSPDERWCVTVGKRGDVVVRELAKQSSQRLGVEVPDGNGAAFSPDGKLVALTSGAGNVQVWRSGTWQPERTLGSFARYTLSAIFSPDGQRLATGGDGKPAVALWNTDGWHDVFAMEGADGIFLDMAFSPDGNVIGSLNQTGVLHLWRAPSWTEIEATEGHPAGRR